MLKERDYLSCARLLDRTMAMDSEPESGDPGDDIDFCTEVLAALAPLRKLLADEISEGDPDMTTAFAGEAINEIDELIVATTTLRDALSGSTRPDGYIPG